MNVAGEKAKRILVVALSLSIGFGAGIMSKEICDTKNSARASEAAAVPVQKVPDAPAQKLPDVDSAKLGDRLNHMIAPHLWDVYVDPLFSPVSWAMRPLPLVPLVSFPATTPKVQTIDGDKELRVIAQVPGMNENDVKVEASEHAITIKAHKKQEEKNNDRFESFDESFEQSVHLPVNVNADAIKATVKDGVLTVTLPKK